MAKAKARKKTDKKLRIQQVRSAIGRPPKQHEVLRGLGLRRMHQVVEREDTPAVRGMVAKVPHLVQLVEDE
jgi:large subunit ribosomal protein L30